MIALEGNLPELRVLEFREPILYRAVMEENGRGGALWKGIIRTLGRRRTGSHRHALTLYLHIADGLELVRKGQYGQTSCKDWEKADELRNVVGEIEKVPEVKIVNRDVQVNFASYIS